MILCGSWLIQRTFCSDITFRGRGCDNRNVLPYSNPDEIEEHVKRRIEIFFPNGGFVFCPVHNILANVPPEDIVRMYDSAIKYGVY